YVEPSTEIEHLFCTIWKHILQIEKVGVSDDFFGLGGDSISAIRMVIMLKEHNIDVAVKDVFKQRTIGKISLLINENKENKISFYTPFSLINLQNVLGQHQISNIAEIEDIYPASYLQIGMLLEEDMANHDGTYHSIFVYKLNASLDAQRVRLIWQSLVNKHALLRTAFLIDPDYGYCAVQYKFLDVSNKIKEIDILDLENYITKEKHVVYNKKTPGLFHVFLAPKSESDFVFMFSAHHAIEDGWSVANLIVEFVEAYLATNSINSNDLPFYGEFVAEEKDAVEKPEHQDFWKNYLKKIDQNKKCLLEKDLIKNEHNDVAIELNKRLSEKIVSLAAKANVVPDVIFMAAYVLTLSSFFKSEDIIFGVVVNNRLERKWGDKLFGLFLNTIPVKIHVEKNGSISKWDLIETIKNEKIKYYQHKQYPYGKIKTDLKLKADIYDFAFTYLHFESLGKLFSSGVLQEIYQYEKTNIPATLHILRKNELFSITLKHKVNFINSRFALELIKKFEYYLEQLITESITTINIYHDSIHFSLEAYENIQVPHIDSSAELIENDDRSPDVTENVLHNKLLSIWSNILPNITISIDDNFFDIGGNSILVLAMQARIQAALQLDNLSIVSLFKYPTIRKLSEYLSSNKFVSNSHQVYYNHAYCD
ncbi:MAG: hypothetical protein EXR81_06890, partial [Gammaproteobacteria bacterium]|nr:hypothetical protein [Gammaproteobacteria bacterium]